MTLQAWLEEGIAAGHCTPAYCDNHDAYHADDWAIVREMPDNDFCWPIVRLKIPAFETAQQFLANDE
jgi:hypothetical protein